MQTQEHKQHLAKYVSHNNCQECRADCERQFLRSQWPGYRFVTEYLSHVRPRLTAIRDGENSVNARHWKREFMRALHRRISLKVAGENGRKHCPGYLQRLRQASHSTNVYYLRQFARRGASTLH